MPVGDINITKLNIGSINLLNPVVCQYLDISVFEDLFNPNGPAAEIKVNDFNDALGSYNFNGDEDIHISFKLLDLPSDHLNFMFKCFENKNLTDRSDERQTAMKSKQYDVYCISEEYLQAQARPNIQKSYDIPIFKAVEDLVKKTGFMSKKPFMCDDPTKGKVRHVASGHSIKIYQELNELAVSMQNKSSAYVLFVSDNTYKYSTIEQLCKYPPVANLKQTTTLSSGGVTEQERLNSITSIKVNTSFFTPPRAKSLTKQSTYDPVTGKATYPQVNPFSQFIHLGNPVYREHNVGIVPPKYGQTEYTQHDRANNLEATDIAAARQNRAAYLAYLAQNTAELLIPGNPNIKLGSVINITIPNKSTNHTGYTERQFNGPVLVTNIRHVIHPLGVQPRYQMRLQVTKAGGYDRGGE
jgi:hypothetical protein